MASMETQGNIHTQITKFTSPVKAQGGISTQMKDFEEDKARKVEEKARKLVTSLDRHSKDTLDKIAGK